MSRHWHSDKQKQVTVLVGYEPEKEPWFGDVSIGRGFFMVVWEVGVPADTYETDHAFSNLDQSPPYSQTLEPYLQHLEDRWGVTLPDELITQLEKDQRENL